MNLLSTLKEKELAKGKRIPFKKGVTIFQEGDLCLGAYFLLKGEIKIASYTLEGREIIYNLLSQNELFGNNLAFSDAPYFRGSVIPLSDGELLFFNKEDFLSLLQNNSEFLQKYLHVQSESIKMLNAKMKLLSLPSASERLYFYLSLNEGRITFDSVSSLASSLFLQRETLSRLLHAEAKKKRIAFNKKEIIRINKD